MRHVPHTSHAPVKATRTPPTSSTCPSRATCSSAVVNTRCASATAYQSIQHCRCTGAPRFQLHKLRLGYASTIRRVRGLTRTLERAEVDFPGAREHGRADVRGAVAGQAAVRPPYRQLPEVAQAAPPVRQDQRGGAQLLQDGPRAGQSVVCPHTMHVHSPPCAPEGLTVGLLGRSGGGGRAVGLASRMGWGGVGWGVVGSGASLGVDRLGRRDPSSRSGC